MKGRICAGCGGVLAAIALSACGGQGSMEDGAMQSDAMPEMESMAAPGNGQHIALGTVNSIDLAAGTINVSHEPVESLGWPTRMQLAGLNPVSKSSFVSQLTMAARSRQSKPLSRDFARKGGA